MQIYLGLLDKVKLIKFGVKAQLFSGLDLKTVRSETTNSTPAQARLYFIGKCTGDFGQSTFYLRLYVPYNSAPYAKFSMPN